MKYDLIIKNGEVVLESGAIKTDVAVKDGKIAAIGTDLGEATKVIDASGLIVTPGMIDAHVHISEPGRTQWEGYVTGTNAAAKGGVTTFIEMPLNQLPVTADRESLKIKFDAAENKMTVDVAVYGALHPRNLDDLQDLSDDGVAGFKAFMSTCGDRSLDNDMENVDDYSLYEGMRRIAKTGKVLLLHCENAAITDRLGKIAEATGPNTLANYVASRPVFTEVEAIRRAIYLAKQTGVRLHICHISCPEGVEEVIKAKTEGMDITCESCTHYFALTTDVLDDIGNTAKCSPPIRDKNNQDKLWEQLFNGDIEFVTSDHSPCTADLKEGPAFSAWGGIAGLQNSYDILFDEAVLKRGMSLKQFVDITATNVADRFNLDNKGRISVGKDADFAFIKANSPYVLETENLEYKNKMSAYVGREIGAQITKTIVRGNIVYDIDSGVTNEFPGQFVLKK
jgi:allantoinase